MLYSRSEPTRRIVVSVEMNVEIARHLLDLCRYYHLGKSDVLSALICQDHESITWPPEPLPNDFIQLPLEPRFLKLDGEEPSK